MSSEEGFFTVCSMVLLQRVHHIVFLFRKRHFTLYCYDDLIDVKCIHIILLIKCN